MNKENFALKLVDEIILKNFKVPNFFIGIILVIHFVKKKIGNFYQKLKWRRRKPHGDVINQLFLMTKIGITIYRVTY